MMDLIALHDDVIKWKHFPRYWPIVRGIHRPTVNSPHKGQWRGALMFSLICARINSCVNNREAVDLRRHCGHYDVIVMAVLIIVEAIIQDVTTVSVLKRRVYGCLFNAQNLETHYSDVIMVAMASQITSLTIVYSTVYSDAGQRKYQSSASLAFARGIHRGPVNSQYKWPVTRKIFPFHDVTMACPWLFAQCAKLGNSSEWEADRCTHVAVRDGDELISDLLLAM